MNLGRRRREGKARRVLRRLVNPGAFCRRHQRRNYCILLLGLLLLLIIIPFLPFAITATAASTAITIAITTAAFTGLSHFSSLPLLRLLLLLVVFTSFSTPAEIGFGPGFDPCGDNCQTALINFCTEGNNFLQMRACWCDSNGDGAAAADDASRRGTGSSEYILRMENCLSTCDPAVSNRRMQRDRMLRFRRLVCDPNAEDPEFRGYYQTRFSTTSCFRPAITRPIPPPTVTPVSSSSRAGGGGVGVGESGTVVVVVPTTVTTTVFSTQTVGSRTSLSTSTSRRQATTRRGLTSSVVDSTTADSSDISPTNTLLVSTSGVGSTNTLITTSGVSPTNTLVSVPTRDVSSTDGLIPTVDTSFTGTPVSTNDISPTDTLISTSSTSTTSTTPSTSLDNITSTTLQTTFSISTLTPPPTPTQTTLITVPALPSTTGLNTGQIIGVFMASVVGFILILFGLFFLSLSRRQQQIRNPLRPSASSPTPSGSDHLLPPGTSGITPPQQTAAGAIGLSAGLRLITTPSTRPRQRQSLQNQRSSRTTPSQYSSTTISSTPTASTTTSHMAIPVFPLPPGIQLPIQVRQQPQQEQERYSTTAYSCSEEEGEVDVDARSLGTESCAYENSLAREQEEALNRLFEDSGRIWEGGGVGGVGEREKVW